MKLGTQTASLVNHLYSRATIGQPTPEVGMGATLLNWTDRYAATIVEVFTKGTTQYVAVTEDTATVTSGDIYSGATYAFETNWDAYRFVFRMNTKSGQWEQVVLNPKTGRYTATKSAGLRIGAREQYIDPSF